MSSSPRRITVLSDDIKQKIAAGEVIEGAHSVVKELVENSIDAGATQISVSIENGGHGRIRVVDNGSGVNPEDLELMIIEHATSKISSIDDLYHINSMGFRGEALSSISAISHFQISSRTREQTNGSFVRGQGGKITQIGKISLKHGTEILVENLFFNTPARRKFLKSKPAENRRIKELIQIFALAHPHIYFRLSNDHKKVLDLPDRSHLLSRIGDIFGKEIMDSLIEISGSAYNFPMTGFISVPGYHRLTRNMQFSFVNKRIVQLPHFSFLVSKGYSSFLESGHHPVVFLFIESNPAEVDVNVHPTKKEIRFERGQDLQSAIIHTISAHLYERDWQRRKNLPAHSNDKPNHSGNSHKQTDTLPPNHNETLLGKKSRFFSKTPQQQFTETNTVTESNTFIKSDKSYKPELVGQNYGNPISQSTEDYATQDEQESQNHLSESSFPEKPTELFLHDNQLNNYLERTSAQSFASTPAATTNTMYFLNEPLRFINSFAKKYILFETVQDYTNSGDDYSNTKKTDRFWENKNSLLLMDFHAAHERILFERLLRKRELSEEATSEPLLIPIVLELSTDEVDLLEEYLDFFITTGLEINIIGPHNIAVHRLPYFIKADNISETMREITAILALHKQGDDDLEREFFRTKSCRSAIKAGYEPSHREILRILADLSLCKEPTRCPHGRPIWSGFSMQELDRLFKRII